DPPPFRRRGPVSLRKQESAVARVIQVRFQGKVIPLLLHDGLAQKLHTQGVPLVEPDALPVYTFTQKGVIHEGARRYDEETRHVEVLAEKVAYFRSRFFSACEWRRRNADFLV